MVDTSLLYALGGALIIVGVLVIVLAMIKRPSSKGSSTEVKGGGVVIIGPVPIVFGSDKKTVRTLLVLSIVLTVLVLVTLLVSYLLSR